MARAGAPRHAPHSYRPSGAMPQLAAEEATALAFLSEILTGEDSWSVGEVRRLLDLKERGRAGAAG